MFAAWNNTHNENAIYERQTAAAAKPLNQGVKGLAPKTPGNKAAPKTPFKGAPNDENAEFKGGKTGLKGKQDGLFADAKGGKAEKATAVTPAGPRTARAPLGNKTTNAKAAAFQTPGPPATQEKPSARGTSPRLRRAKVKIHHAEADPLNDDSDVPDIEYMAPRGVPLPDYPDDCWPHDRTYPQFEGNNFTKGWWSASQPEKDDEDDEADFMDFVGKMKALEEKAKKAEQACKGRGVRTAQMKQPSTIRSKDAASALASTTRVAAKTPSFAAPTASAKARMPSTATSRKPAALSATARGNTRHTAAKIASNTTLGYSKGRAVSATARPPSMNTHRRDPAVSAANRNSSPMKLPFSGGTTLDDLLGLERLTLGEGEGEQDDGFAALGGRPFGEDEEDDEYADFQLQAVEI